MSLKDFQFLSKLGEGAFSSVFKARRLIDSCYYAIKRVKLGDLTEREKDNALNEVRILASVRDQNVVGYKEAFLEREGNYLYIVMQYADGGDLFQRISNLAKEGRSFSQTEIWSIFVQTVRGLKALHQLKILHRDIKSANIFLFNNGQVKLGDMNVSKVTRSPSKTQTGTPYYAPPQVWKEEPHDKKSDIWSLGCVIYQAITLKPPFRGGSMQQLYRKIIRGFYAGIPNTYSTQLSFVLKNMLQVAPHLRLSCEKLLELPIVTKHFKEVPGETQTTVRRAKPKMMDTIRLSRNMKDELVMSQVPKPRYLSIDPVESPEPQLMPYESIDDRSSQNTLPTTHPSQRLQPVVDLSHVGRPSQNIRLPKLTEPSERSISTIEPRWNEKSQLVKQLLNVGGGGGPLMPSSTPSARRVDGMLPRRAISISSDKRGLNSSANGSYSIVNGSHPLKNPSIHPGNYLYRRQSSNHDSLTQMQSPLPSLLQGRLKSMSPQNIRKLVDREKEKKRLYSIVGNND